MTRIFTQSGWLILFSPYHLSGQHQIGENCQTLSLPQNFFVQDRHNDCSLSSITDQGFPVECELDEFNIPHTGTTFSRLQYWLCPLQCKIPLQHLVTSSLDNIFWRYSRFSPKQPEPQTHGWPQHSCPQPTNTTFATLMATYLPHTFNNALTLQCTSSLRHLAAKMLSQLYNNFILFPYFFPPYKTCSININPLFHAAIKNHHKNLTTSLYFSLPFI